MQFSLNTSLAQNWAQGSYTYVYEPDVQKIPA